MNHNLLMMLSNYNKLNFHFKLRFNSFTQIEKGRLLWMTKKSKILKYSNNSHNEFKASDSNPIKFSVA